MNAIADRHSVASLTELVRGRVALADGGRFIVRTTSGSACVTRRAASCLLEPAPDDEVLVATGADAFILAVLERRAEGPSRLVTQGDATLVAEGGSIVIHGDTGATLSSSDEVSVVAPTLSIAADRVDGVVQDIRLIGRSLSARLETLGLEARAIERVAERVVERAERVYRFIQGAEQVRAGEIDQRAEGVLSLRAEHAVVHARKIVKMDGEQMHIG